MNDNIRIEDLAKKILYINDFGVTYGGDHTAFKVWAPYSDSVKVAIYENYNDYRRIEYEMEKDVNGVWTTEIKNDIKNYYYNYIVTNHGQAFEITDPYATAATANSKKAMIVDFEDTNPEGWLEHKIPDSIRPCESILYEAHIRDFSVYEESGMKYKGLYLCFTETDTQYKNFKTGIGHLKELGVTHLHLLPVFDFCTVDEIRKDTYNWGYDPVLFNVPEGSYATDPCDGKVRIREFKEMVKSLHENGIRVVMDVVYNHTFHTAKANFNYLTRDYFYRTNDRGYFTNGSGVGNELATEEPMVQKFIIDSLKYWMKEYKIDGFRFDLMGLYDIETCRRISEELHEIRPDIILYGEPWIGWESSLPHSHQMKKGSQRGMGIALFNDDYRNNLKGDNDGFNRGFVMGENGHDHWVKYGISGGIKYDAHIEGFTDFASETVNYVSSHDNLCLYDKLVKTEGNHDEVRLEKMNKLALSMVLTSFGIPFLQAGTEFLRSKKGHHNSYNAGDEINQIDWSLKEKYFEVYSFIKDLIVFRKSQKIMQAEEVHTIKRGLRFLKSPERTVKYLIKSRYKGDYRRILIMHNANNNEVCISGKRLKGYRYMTMGHRLELDYFKMPIVYEEKIEIPPISTCIFVKKM